MTGCKGKEKENGRVTDMQIPNPTNRRTTESLSLTGNSGNSFSYFTLGLCSWLPSSFTNSGDY